MPSVAYLRYAVAKVRRMFYIASDLLKTLRMINKVSRAIYLLAVAYAINVFSNRGNTYE